MSKNISFPILELLTTFVQYKYQMDYLLQVKTN